MCPDVSNSDPLGRVSVQNFLDQVLEVWTERRWNCEVAGKDFFVEFICVGVFKGKIAACHGVENDAAGPDIRCKAIVFLAGDHLGGSVAWTSTCSFQQPTIAIGI